MSDPDILRSSSDDDPVKKHPRGPSLILLYSIIALALGLAIGFALLIVMPFYRHRY